MHLPASSQYQNCQLEMLFLLEIIPVAIQPLNHFYRHLIGEPGSNGTTLVAFHRNLSSHPSSVTSETGKQRGFVFFFGLFVDKPSLACTASDQTDLRLIRCFLETKRDIWGLKHPSSPHKEDLSQSTISQGMLFIFCDSNKVDYK